jgi:MFS family permease
LFLFPSIIVYDAGLHSGNDHMAAFFALPLWVAAHRSWRALEPGRLSLFSLMAAGALLTKYQCAAIVLGPALALIGRAVWLAARRRSIHWCRGVALALVVGVLATTPHWLKNWLWFGDPLFPALHRHLDVHPWYPGAGEIIEWNYNRLMARPEGTPREQLWQIVRGSFQFGFRPETGFHKDWPIFGPLFTLSLTWLVFLQGARRLWLLAGATQCGLFFWYFFSYYERYMQPLVPWMAAVVAGSIVLIARRGWAARAALAGLLALVLVWGGDAYFIPHWLLEDSTIRVSASLLGAAYRGEAATRQNFRSPHKEIGEALPPDARVLLHEQQLRLGLARPIVQDYAGFQTRFSYEQMGSAREVYDLYRELGVTHMIWEHQKAGRVDSLAGDLRFWQFAANHALGHRRFGKLTVAEVPAEPPTPLSPGHVEQVAYLSCDRAYAPGLYPVSLMNTHLGDGRHVPPPVPAPEIPADLVAFTQGAAFIVVDPRCRGKQWPIPQPVFGPFVRVARRGPEELWVRKRDAPVP